MAHAAGIRAESAAPGAGMLSAATEVMPDGLGNDVSAVALAAALRNRECPSDHAFDQLLPEDVRSSSREHWSPLEVAVVAASWLDTLGIRTVADIGSGAGKFCVAAALAGNARYVGIEHRERLVSAARRLAALFKVSDRVEFVAATFDQAAPPIADAYYFFNPFEENLYFDGFIDEDVELSGARFQRDVTGAEVLMQRAPAGTYVLTYNGFGGDMPAAYQLIQIACDLPCVLQLWRKSADATDAENERGGRRARLSWWRIES